MLKQCLREETSGMATWVPVDQQAGTRCKGPVVSHTSTRSLCGWDNEAFIELFFIDKNLGARYFLCSAFFFPVTMTSITSCNSPKWRLTSIILPTTKTHPSHLLGGCSLKITSCCLGVAAPLEDPENLRQWSVIYLVRKLAAAFVVQFLDNGKMQSVRLAPLS